MLLLSVVNGCMFVYNIKKKPVAAIYSKNVLRCPGHVGGESGKDCSSM